MYSVLLAAGLFMLFFALLVLLAYIPLSIGLYRMALKCGIENPWMAWVPLANLYVVGLIIRELKFQNYDIPKPEIVLPAAFVINLVVAKIPVISALYGLALLVLTLLALFRLFTIFKKDSAMLFTVLSLIPLVGAFLILSVSKYDPEY